jgi:hypothetical protein
MGFVVKECSCNECGATFLHGKKLSEHFRKEHNLTSETYAIKFLHDGTKPSCLNCGKETRFVSAFLGFKRYCGSCSTVAEREAGRVGGKIKQTWNKGQTKETDERIATLAINQSGTGNPFFGRHHTAETIAKISLTKTLSGNDLVERILKRDSEFKLITPIETYVSRQQQYLEFKCNLCETVQPKTLQAFERGSRCYKCFPASKSNWELDVFSFVQSLCDDAISGDRSILSPKEIDVYVPSKRLGVECHGLYWHSEGSPRGSLDKHSHLEKHRLAAEKQVKLLQIFQDEWRDKRIICESLIRHRLGMSLRRIGARKLRLDALDVDRRKQFFETSHIAGDVPSTRAWALFDGETVVAALSIRHPRQAHKYTNTMEIARFCTAPFVSIPGGLNRLMGVAMTHVKEIGATQLLTYVDRRIGDGHGYEQCEFKRTGETGIDYFYTDNFLRYDRFKFRAQEDMTESDVARNAGVSKIYGCGSYVYVKQL